MGATLKLASLATAGMLGVGAIAYTGGSLVDGVKGNIDALERQVKLVLDEGANKISTANLWIDEKNEEISRLTTELEDANNSIEQANKDMEGLASHSEQAVTEVKGAKLPNLEDTSTYVIDGQKLVITVVQNQDTESERKIRVSNKNNVPVSGTVTRSGGGGTTEFTIPAGEVIYFSKNNSGEMLTFKYNVPGTEETISNVK